MISRDINNINDLSKLIREFDRLHSLNQDYVFRGQSNYKHELLPSAFRPSVIKSRDESFPREFSTKKVQFEGRALEIIIGNCAGDKEYAKAYMASYDYQKVFEIIDFIIKYNYDISRFKHASKDKRTIELQGFRPPSFWLSADAYFEALEYRARGMQSIITIHDGKMVKEGKIDNELTGFDQSLPQHYQVPTATLDWSSNPYVAIFFASYQREMTDEIPYISVYVCNKTMVSESDPVIFNSGHPDIVNPRLINQDGLFSTIQTPCEYYFHYRSWPSIDKLLPHMSRDIGMTKYNISIHLLDEIKILLDSKGICESFIYPDIEVL